MKTYHLSADIKETNRYEFMVVGDSREEAETRLMNYLEKNCPNVNQDEYEDGVLCQDREAGRETGEVVKIK